MDSFNYAKVYNQSLDLDLFARKIFDFVEYSKAQYNCETTLEVVHDALEKFVKEVQLERAGMEVGHRVI